MAAQILKEAGDRPPLAGDTRTDRESGQSSENICRDGDFSQATRPGFPPPWPPALAFLETDHGNTPLIGRAQRH